MIRLQNLTLRRGQKILFQDSNANIFAQQKIGLIGANGSGKSSLFALFQQELQQDSGEYDAPKSLVIATVRQETPALERAAIQYVIDGDHHLRQLEQKIIIAENTHNHERLATLHAQFADCDGYSAHARAAALLHGLGFQAKEIENPLASFSGGWRMRLNLAQALMCPSDLLLLDEPTNHLDLEAIVWLEQWLKRYPGTLIIISHDREFLDTSVNHIVVC